MTCPEPFPVSLSQPTDTENILQSLRDYVGIHRIVFDDNDNVGDAELIWWNDAYEKVRVKPVQFRQSLMGTYFEPHIAMKYVQQAWTEGSAKQIFELNEDTTDRYRTPETLVRIEVAWLRVADLIVEIGSDLSEMTQLEMELIAQRQAYTDATRESLLSMERARISQDLHDSIIQSLFAISLNLRARDDKEWAIEAIHSAINEIRQTIFAIEPTSQAPLYVVVEKAIALFAPVWPTPPELDFHIEHELPNDVARDVENVVREGLSNTARHAKADKVVVRVHATRDDVTIVISDNGIGPQGALRRRSGMTSLEKRAHSHGGSCTISHAHPAGTTLTWSCPLHKL